MHSGLALSLAGYINFYSLPCGGGRNYIRHLSTVAVRLRVANR